MNFSSTLAPLVTAAPSGGPARLRVRVKRALTIQRDPMEMYSFWLDTLAPEESSADLPAQVSDAVVTKTIPGQLISWTIEADDETGPHTGTVRFEPAVGDQGTEVSVVVEFYSPGGKLADARVKYTSRDAADRVVAALVMLKGVMEGEDIPTVAAAPVQVPQLRSDPMVTGLKLRIGRLEAPISNMMEGMLPQWMGGASTAVER